MTNLNKYTDDLSKIIENNNFETPVWVKDRLELIKNRINENEFKIAVVGEFSSGKSTFINSLLGRDILKHAKDVTTAVITYIHNVGKIDRRNNTFDVYLTNGEVEKGKKLENIEVYTVEKKEGFYFRGKKHNFEEIESVHIYMNFFDFLGNGKAVKRNVTIVDTPGLNGTYKNHKPMTMNEIQKSHACIYILPFSGFSESSLLEIKEIMKYQSTFIFVQNHIDELKSTEGETPEGKITKDKNDLYTYLGDLCKGKKIEFCGISALMALTAKDKSIKKLYEDSTNELTESERNTLYEKSNIKQFYDIIEKLLNDKDFDKRRENDCCEALILLVKDIEFFLKGRNESNIFAQEDLKNKNVQEKKKRLEEIDKRKGTELRILYGSIDRDFAEGRKMLAAKYYKTIADSPAENLISIGRSNIINKINAYTKYDEIKKCVENDIINNDISGFVKDINDKLKHDKEVSANYILKRAYSKINDRFTGKSKGIDDDKPDFISTLVINNQADLTDDESRIKFLEEKINNLYRKLEEQKEAKVSDSDKGTKNIKNLENELQVLKRERDSIKYGLDSLRANKPDVGKKPIDIPKRFLWVHYTKTVMVDDYSDIEQWEKNIAGQEALLAAEEAEIIKKTTDLTNAINSLKGGKGTHDMIIKALEQDIVNNERWLEEAKKDRNTKIEIAQNEYVKLQKEKLKEGVNKYFDAFAELVEENINEDTRNFSGVIKAYVKNEFDTRIKERIKIIEDSIKSSSKDDKRIDEYKDIIKSLDNILKALEN